ncbi:MAG: hypothetical protein ACYTFY_15085 [Planctomycetota bacterium]|jgi:hypothetical protein
MEQHNNINKLTILGLALVCPLSTQNDNCPFAEYRKLSPESREEAISSLTDEEIMRLMNYHSCCHRL